MTKPHTNQGPRSRPSRTRFHLPSFGSIAHDLRYSARTLRRSPGFTLVAVMVLALGIGANTAVFSVLSAVLLQPLPFKQPDRLVLVSDDLTVRGPAAQFPVPPGVYVDWKNRSRSFQDIAAMAIGNYNLTGRGEPIRLQGARTTTNLFSLLGTQPILGRTFSPTDEGPEGNPVVIVSRSLWLQRFAGDPGLIGRSIVLNGSKRTVIGVVPDNFKWPSEDTDVWVPADFTPRELAVRNNHYLYVVARLKPGVSLDQAQADMSLIGTTLTREHPLTDKYWRATVTPLHEKLARTARPALFLLIGAVGMVLLIACANVANLLMARSETRRKELALRQALGAGQGRMLRQLLTESAVLGGLGLIAGVALSTATFAYLSRLIPATLPSGTSPSLDWRVLAFTAALTVLTILLFGSGPALAATRIGFSEALKKGGVGRRSAGERLRNLLVVGEIGLTVVLLIGAGLLLRSYASVLAVNPGFESRHLLLAETDLSPSRYTRPADRRNFYVRALDSVSALPGVTGAGYASSKPLSLSSSAVGLTIEGQPAPQGKDAGRNLVRAWVVSAGYFSALGVPLIRGRLFDNRDGPNATPTVIINQAMARQHWPGQNPIGKRFKIGGLESEAPWFTVVGVVGNILVSLDAPPAPVIYRPLSQEGRVSWPRYLVVRTRRDPMTLAAAVRQAIWAVEPDQPVSNIKSMTQVIDQQLSNRNTQLTLVGGLALLALVVAAVGLYGVLSYLVAQRTSEIGLRMALGAQPGNVIRSVVHSALLLATTGVVVGIAGALVLSRLLTAFLYGVSSRDPITFVVVPALLVLVTVLASYVPARRATNVDPVSALRTE